MRPLIFPLLSALSLLCIACSSSGDSTSTTDDETSTGPTTTSGATTGSTTTGSTTNPTEAAETHASHTEDPSHATGESTSTTGTTTSTTHATEHGDTGTDTGVASVQAYCECMLINCHDQYHGTWGEDHRDSEAMCAAAAEALPSVGTPATRGNSLECRYHYCEIGHDDPTACESAIGGGACV